MRLKDQFQFVRQNMKKNRTRMFMTILATAMSVAFLIVLASVGFGLHKSIVKETLERRLVTEIEVPGKEEPNNGFRQLTDEDISYFEEIDEVKAVTRRKTLQNYMFEVDDHQTNAQAIVAHMPSETKAGLELAEGRLPKSENEVVVGYHFVEDLRPNREVSEELYDEQGQIKEEFRYKEDLIGKKITMNVVKFEDGKEMIEPLEVTVVGIRQKPTKDWVYDSIVFVSEGVLKQVEEFTGTPRGMMKDPNNPDMELPDIPLDQYDQVNIYAKDMEAVKDITAVLEENNYPSYSVINELKDINVMFTIVKAGLIFIGTIAIIIASIGIYNTMTMAVTERAPDIGIMKAIGANPKTIKKIFLLESSYIGLVGAAIGTLVAYGISFIVNFGLPLIIKQAFGEEPPEGLIFSHIPYTLPIISFIICYLVTILSGLRPAQRATKVDVLQAMRREV
ncbi:ABC transporter permease [Mesobacillus selenatarsenatis]|uniref:ABC transporter, permease protein n=1 Tax=Mesobacillus selenatarsenatis (strain DSM 18680 / JCM 14380 / FERM P-15431 / SF-1) TaxID=1321606 RepID=A0A0A8X723_MESS1|nr:FtsX-like permease family protein [Mesobacillus selenatarsenatis]GAM13896.1 ABC transporter, permease protein [Mesobacillus selenatarsenatis SF-1]